MLLEPNVDESVGRDEPLVAGGEFPALTGWRNAPLRATRERDIGLRYTRITLWSNLHIGPDFTAAPASAIRHIAHRKRQEARRLKVG